MSSAALNGTSWILTRPHERAVPWVQFLESHGAVVMNDPVLQLQPIQNSIDIEIIRDADLLLFSSATTVDHFFSLLSVSLREILEDGSLPKFAAVGATTAETVRAHGFEVDFEGPGTGAADLVNLVLESSFSGSAVHVTSDAGLPLIVDKLGEAGILCTRLEVSHSSLVPGLDISKWYSNRDRLTGIIYSSPATVRGVVDQSGDFKSWICSIPGIAVGEKTGAAMRGVGIDFCVVADSADQNALLEACVSVISTGNMRNDQQD